MHHGTTMVIRYLLCFLLVQQASGKRVHAQVVREVFFTVPINLKFPDERLVGLTPADGDSLYHDHAVLKLPAGYTPDGPPVRLVYMAHGAGGGVTADDWFLNRFDLQRTLLDEGYAVFDVNGGPLVENMGGSWAVQSAYKAYAYIRNHYNVHPQIMVGGFSMGGLSSVNFVYKHSSIVLAHVLFSPVLDVYEQAWKNPWMSSTRQAIAQVYNFTDQSGNTWEETKVTGWNPLRIHTFYNGTDTVKIYPVPVKIWHGTRDRVVPIASSRLFQQYIRNAGGYIALREIDSDDHGLSCGNPVINRELVLFLKRF